MFEKTVAPILQAWFEEERGNRVTSNNMQMLFNKLSAALTAEGIPPGKKEKE